MKKLWENVVGAENTSPMMLTIYQNDNRMKKKQRIKRKDGLKRQSQIMSVALGLFAEKGYNATSVDDIIKKSKIAKGTFYLHFEGKLDILHKIVDTYLKMIFNFIKVLDISLPKPIDEIRKLYLSVAKIITEVPEFEQFTKILLRDASGLDPSVLDKVNMFFTDIIQMSSEYIENAQQNGRVDPALDPLIASTCIFGATREILYRWIVLGGDFDMDHTINNMLNLFLKGILVASE